MAKKAKENKLIFGNVEEFPEKEVTAETKGKTKKEAAKSDKKKYFKFLADERFLKSAGIFFVFFSLFLFVSCLSFFSVWESDQSLVRSISWGMLSETQPNLAENLLGIMGAWLSYVFIYKGFGIASFAFVLLFFLLGILLLTNLQPISISKTLRYSFFGGIWLSLTMAFLFHSANPLLAGSFGHFGFLYLKSLLGYAGTGFALLAYVLIFFVAVFNIKFYESKPVEEKSTTNSLSTVGENEKSISEIENVPIDGNDFVLTQLPVEQKSELQAPEPEIMPATVEAISAEEQGLVLEINESAPDEIEEIKDTPEVPIEIPDHAAMEPETESVQTETKTGLTTDSGLVLQVQETPVEEETDLDATPAHSGLTTPYDPTLDYSHYQFPTLDLLNDYGDNKAKVESAELSEKTRMIEETLKNYGIGIKRISATIGPTVTLYEIIPQDGVRIAKIKNLEDDIALSLAALGIRIIAPIPGRGTIGIEVPNANPAMVSMRSVLSSPKFIHAEMDLPIAFGKTISNEVFVTDLAKMPHLLMAGATGQGKSVGLNCVLASLLYKKHPSQIKFVLVDPKKVELNIYKTIERHFLAKIPGDQDAILTDTKLVIHTLNSLCKEMDDRYDLLKDAQVRNLKEYNAKFISRRLPPTDKIKHRYLPYIIVVIDELADLMMTAGKEVEFPIARLAQLARAIGIHLILATQRPSVNIITGTIKANFPARLAFRVSQKIDSRTILDANGADQLIGKGDMLFSNGNDLIRLQCAFVDTPEVEKITDFIGSQQGREPYELPLVQTESDDVGGGEGFDHENRDSLFEEAARLIVVHQQGSTSLIQRRLNLGYNRAGRLIDQLEKAGIVGPFKGSKAREVIVKTEAELEEVLSRL
ncbi:MAG: DNA translocase FtsK [bacterium]|nr:DNA translocase FtsK [bacterium]